MFVSLGLEYWPRIISDSGATFAARHTPNDASKRIEYEHFQSNLALNQRLADAEHTHVCNAYAKCLWSAFYWRVSRNQNYCFVTIIGHIQV